MTKQLKYFHDSLNIVVNIVAPLVNVPNFLEHSKNKINWWTFSPGTVVIHLLDKTYQEINFKSYSNTMILCKLRNILSDMHMLHLILFHLFLLVLNLLLKLKDANYKIHWNI